MSYQKAIIPKEHAPMTNNQLVNLKPTHQQTLGKISRLAFFVLGVESLGIMLISVESLQVIQARIC